MYPAKKCYIRGTDFALVEHKNGDVVLAADYDALMSAFLEVKDQLFRKELDLADLQQGYNVIDQAYGVMIDLHYKAVKDLNDYKAEMAYNGLIDNG